MNIRELIEHLEECASEHGDEVEVRLAQQPSWPFEYSVGQIVAVDSGQPDPDEFDSPEEYDAACERHEADGSDAVICYIAESGQIGYLPSIATDALNWGGR